MHAKLRIRHASRRRDLAEQRADAPATSATKAPPAWRAPEVTGRPGCGARRRRGLAAVPVGGGAWLRGQHTSARKPPDKFRMQFPHRMNRHEFKNRRISTIRSQTPKCAHGNCMRNRWLTAIAGFQGDVSSRRSAPRHHWHGGRRRSRRAWLRCAWAAGPGLPQKSHAIRLGEDSTRPKDVAISAL